jgi:hypothetical protein
VASNGEASGGVGAERRQVRASEARSGAVSARKRNGKEGSRPVHVRGYKVVGNWRWWNTKVAAVRTVPMSGLNGALMRGLHRV